MCVAVIIRNDGQVLTTRAYWSEVLAFNVLDDNLKVKDNHNSIGYLCEV